jgi:hypothetical protein
MGCIGFLLLILGFSTAQVWIIIFGMILITLGVIKKDNRHGRL